jgi:tRNA G18 (ribose-2'-O)-methylase SpoU
LVLVGNELPGFLGDQTIEIPQYGIKQSLNAVAYGIAVLN